MYGRCCWVVVNQYSELENDPVTECPIFGSNRDLDGVRLFPLAKSGAWRVARVIHLVKHPSRPNLFIWNKWIWKELSRSSKYGARSTPYYSRFTRVENYPDDEDSSDFEEFNEG